jgi:hypothetical protein
MNQRGDSSLDDSAPLGDASVSQLLEEVVASARALLADELALAAADAEAELRAVKRACALVVLSAFAAGAGLAWGGVALIMALELGAPGAGLFALFGTLVALLGGWLAQRALPPAPFYRTRARLARHLHPATEVYR